MFKRRIEEELKSWKISTIRKPLVLRGARQVGKTSTVRKFAAENFENFVEINLERADQNKYFRQADTVEEFVKRAEYFTNPCIQPQPLGWRLKHSLWHTWANGV